MDEPGERPLPVLVFDGSCGFCTAAVDWLDRHLAEPARALPYQRADLAELGLTERQAEAEVWWLTPRGERLAGARATARALRACRPPWGWIGAWIGGWMRAPGARSVAAWAYGLVARHRGRLPGATPECRRSPPAPGGRWIGPATPPPGD